MVLASKKSRADALNAFVELQQKYPAVLANETSDVQESNLGDKDILVSREAARRVCNKLITAGHNVCWVAA